MSLLFGILIAVGRLSADSEIIAMRALGISTRTIYRPVFLFSVAIFVLNFYLINFVVRRQTSSRRSSEADHVVVQKEIEPRVFFDQYENLMIYVNDVDPATGQWKGVFVADSRPDERADATTRGDRRGRRSQAIRGERRFTPARRPAHRRRRAGNLSPCTRLTRSG